MTRRTELAAPATDATRSTTPIEGLRVSILVPTYNRANYLGECLESLLAQTMPALEIIVIDDGSEDGTAGILKGYGQRIRYIRKENGGKPTAVNLGLSLAQGDLIWIFDDDDVALPRAIESRVKVLQARPDAGFVFSPHYYGTDGDNGTIRQGRLHAIQPYSTDSFFFELMKGCFFHLATALVRTDAYRAVGGFDTELLSSEDYDMQLRLAHAFPAAYCPEPTFIFRQHSGLRGAKAIRYAGNQRSKVFRRFDQRVGQKLRSGLSLGDYLVPRREAISDPLKSKEALLGRMTIMGSKGCLPEMFEDLSAFVSLVPRGVTQLSPAERQTIAAAVRLGYAPQVIGDHWAEFKLLLACVPKLPMRRAVFGAIAHGLYKFAKGYPGSFSERCSRLKRAGFVALKAVL